LLCHAPLFLLAARFQRDLGTKEAVGTSRTETALFSVLRIAACCVAISEVGPYEARSSNSSGLRGMTAEAVIPGAEAVRLA